MPYVLHHYFDPDFDHHVLKPRELENGSVDHYDLNYVQNVVENQVLAEWREVHDPGAEGIDPRYVFESKKLPMGPNTAPNPDNPDQLVSTANGYVYYNDGMITVKKLLNVRRTVDFNTGNILYVNDMVVHGMVRSGFKLRGRNIQVKDLVEGAEITATSSLSLDGGVKGGGQALLSAGKSIKTSFAENATLKAGQNILVEYSSLNNTIFAGQKLAVRGRLIGGHAYCYKYAYVLEQLGGGGQTTTNITIGYDPLLFHKAHEMDEKLKELQAQIETLRGQGEKNEELAREFEPKINAMEKNLVLLQARKEKVWERLESTQRLDSCRIIVPGRVKPGVEIRIGNAYLKVSDFYEDVYFALDGDKIITGSPALKKQYSMDIATVIGLFGGLGLIIGAIFMGGGLAGFIDIPSVIIVGGGTLTSAFTMFPLKNVIGSFKVLMKTFFAKNRNAESIIKEILNLADTARKQSLVALEKVSVDDPFLKKGVIMVADGSEEQVVRSVMEIEINFMKKRHLTGQGVFKGMGTMAPAFGMIGTLIGLVRMLQNLSDPASIGPAMAVALLTTFYGAVIANVICLPLAKKLEERSIEEALYMEIMTEGIVSIQRGEHPAVVTEKLQAFLSPDQRTIGS